MKTFQSLYEIKRSPIELKNTAINLIWNKKVPHRIKEYSDKPFLVWFEFLD